ncbi:M61 family metallopeptidase [Sphingomonas morindae]|uniref:Peptidase M61 n=1 Tax=Sphingomonas morindae TaxID=1541170 RepID=A0ABY4XB02_9SPHN|nr:peptidase M61 [Sphingomonas morindae]USI74143.1 peptidase M61 [Sphingomonas morindae]
MTRFARALASAALFALAAPLAAQQPATNSLPQPLPIPDTIPAAQDTPYPGTIRLAVDASDTSQGIFKVRETIPVAAAGPLVLLYPQWIPGTHSPTGPISKLAGLRFTGNGQVIPWTRDKYDVYAFHLDVPAGVTSVEAVFDYLSPTDDNQGGLVMTPDMLNLDWSAMSLYPAGHFVRRILVSPSVSYPAGWKSASALIPGLSGDKVAYPTVDYETLVDSPAMAGRYARSEPLSPKVNLNIIADRPDQLVIKPEQLKPHKELVVQARKLFGAEHYDHYDFLFWLSDTMGGQGLEHHRSSEDGVDGDYFTDWDGAIRDRNLLPHEYTHSWDGKFRRGADLWTPDYRQPMGDSLLWVYEGQTQYWGYILQARSGLVSKADTLDQLAATAAYYQNSPAKTWRTVVDTTNDPTMSQRRPLGWRNYQWSEDYYEAGKLVWLDADQLIREKTGGKKSLDDFARLFFGMRDGDWGVLTYRFEDVVDTLNKVMPYDWASFLKERIYAVRDQAPLDWITRGGYKLVYTDTPGAAWKAGETRRKMKDFSYSIGFAVGREGRLASVAWDSPAFKAGLTQGTKLLAVNGHSYDDDQLKVAIVAAQTSKAPIRFVILQNDQVRTIDIPYAGGLRYPHLEKTGKGEGGLDKLLAPKA